MNRTGRRQDFFRDRVLFPIFDAQGDPVSFGGRVLPGGDGPKYRNTSETALYHKSRVLYGLNWAKAEIVNADEVIICEGYTDVIGFAAAEVPRAVATCGTALTEDHVVQLRKFARRVVLAFDPDSAGKAAADRVYAWERSHDIDVAVVELPEGADPADLARPRPGAAAPGRRRGAAVPGLPRRAGAWRARSSVRRKAAPAPPRPRWPSSPSTRATSCATRT